MIKNIIFDWSGVLSDDFSPVYKATMNVFKKLGIKTISIQEYKKEFLLPYMDFYRKFTDATKQKVDDLFFKEINLVGSPKPFPKAKSVLISLKNKGIKIILLSSHPNVRKEVKDYDFENIFTDINSGVHNKIKVIKEIMKKNNFKSKETVYVGDMVHDIEAGKKANVKTIAVSWGYDSKEKLSKRKPDFIIENLDEVFKIVA